MVPCSITCTVLSYWRSWYYNIHLYWPPITFIFWLYTIQKLYCCPSIVTNQIIKVRYYFIRKIESKIPVYLFTCIRHPIHQNDAKFGYITHQWLDRNKLILQHSNYTVISRILIGTPLSWCLLLIPPVVKVFINRSLLENWLKVLYEKWFITVKLSCDPS